MSEWLCHPSLHCITMHCTNPSLHLLSQIKLTLSHSSRALLRTCALQTHLPPPIRHPFNFPPLNQKRNPPPKASSPLQTNTPTTRIGHTHTHRAYTHTHKLLLLLPVSLILSLPLNSPFPTHKIDLHYSNRPRTFSSSILLKEHHYC